MMAKRPCTARRGVNFHRVMVIIAFACCYWLGLIQFPVASAQTIRATVDLELNALPDEKREKLSNFKNVLEDYLNNFKWTNDEFIGEIKVSLNMLLQDISVSYEDRYKVQLLISNNSDVQYSDKRCRMEYQKGEIPVHSENNWDSLTSLLDFYMNIIIGEEMDKFGHLLGNSYFEKAKLIAEQARFGMGQFIEGWDIRVELIHDLVSDKTKKYREMKDFYFYGLYFAKEDPAKARTYCKEAINMLEEIKKQENPKFKRVDNFLQAHYIEIVELFKNSPDRDIFRKLIQLDPNRENIYKELL
ncbi:MAG: DUF4835 family protein [candidate division KSB1 bacterium]|nr:DUF4835 family protein [candidate division KSB1 bacterium]MDZ7317601.1 DUF4835 family protein [candidate division KSB1 bacterium]MDZ7340302.1 DUF4835 family protein [candidate division KSB1 bacterium]